MLVEHVRVVKKTVSTEPQKRTKGGIAEQESPINISNVTLVCPNCDPSRVGHKMKATRKRAHLQDSADRHCRRRSKQLSHSANNAEQERSMKRDRYS